MLLGLPLLRRTFPTAFPGAAAGPRGCVGHWQTLELRLVKGSRELTISTMTKWTWVNTEVKEHYRACKRPVLSSVSKGRGWGLEWLGEASQTSGEIQPLGYLYQRQECTSAPSWILGSAQIQHPGLKRPWLRYIKKQVPPPSIRRLLTALPVNSTLVG